MEEEEYVFDAFDGAEREPSEVHYDKLKSFLTKYAEQLSDIQDSLVESLSDVWTPTSDPIGLDFNPLSRRNPVDILFPEKEPEKEEGESDIVQGEEGMHPVVPESGQEEKLMAKGMLTFLTLVKEMNSLTNHARSFIRPLSLFCDESLNEGFPSDPEYKRGVPDGAEQVRFSRLLTLLHDVWHFRNRCMVIIHNTVRQLASAHMSPDNYKAIFGSGKVHYVTIFDSLVSVLSAVMTLDELLYSNSAFETSFETFKRMLRSVGTDPGRFGTDAEQLRRMMRVLDWLQGDLISGKLLDNCIDQDFESILQIPGVHVPPTDGFPASSFVDIRRNSILQDEFSWQLKRLIDDLMPRLGSDKEGDRRIRFVGVCGLYALFYHMFRNHEEKKLFREMWLLHKKVPVIVLSGSTVFCPGEFLFKKLEALVSRFGVKDPRKEIVEAKEVAVSQMDDSLMALVEGTYLELGRWVVRMEDRSVEPSILKMINDEANLIVEGFYLASTLNTTIQTSLGLHLHLDRPFTSFAHVLALCRCMEMMKSVLHAYHRRSPLMARNVPYIVMKLASSIQKVILPARVKLEALAQSKKHRGDIGTQTLFHGSKFLMEALDNAPSDDMLILESLLLAFVSQKGVLKSREAESTRSWLQALEFVSCFGEKVSVMCDLEFLYFHRHLIPMYFKAVYETPENAYRLPYIFAGLRDCEKLAKSALHVDGDELAKEFKNEILDEFDSEIVKPLARDIENDLRVHVHSVVLGQQHAVVSDHYSSKDFIHFFKLRPLRAFGSYIDLKTRISRYLDRTFYTLTCLAQQQWKTYGEMRNLATEKYGLDLAEVHLPGATVEQGLDVLVITRNIHVFVSNYSYNLNTQMFVEKPSMTSSKHLNTIQIHHIASSIRTHGTGIMNTAVNMVYRFLGKKFFVFSQFLYDDHIKSPLIKDARFFRDNRDELGNIYPVKRALKFVKSVRKLGLDENNMSYLDKFRDLITEIGNALGYVRMVRSGGLHYISNAVKFLPDLGNIVKFEDECQKCGLSAHTIASARNLDSVISNLTTKFSGGADYFQILVNVFRAEFQREENLHLKNFYIIIAPLTISFVESMIGQKDRLQRKGKDGLFTDDGFALGVAFILKLLDQNTAFNSLHWFDGVMKHYHDEVQTVLEKISRKRKGNDDEVQTMKLTASRLQMYDREMRHLFYTFSGARVFY